MVGCDGARTKARAKTRAAQLRCVRARVLYDRAWSGRARFPFLRSRTVWQGLVRMFPTPFRAQHCGLAFWRLAPCVGSARALGMRTPRLDYLFGL